MHELGPGHEAVPPHEPLPPQLVSQAHEFTQSMLPAQLDGPPQLTWQLPVPHSVVPVQLIEPPHVMTHAVAALQSMPPAHELAPAQSTVQAQPAGHVTCDAHELSRAHRIVQVEPVHDVHSGGQTEASGGRASGEPASPLASISAASMVSPPSPLTTHHPPVQTRPDGQVPWSQRNAPERVSTEQLAASAAAARANVASPRAVRRTLTTRPRRPASRDRRRPPG